MHTERPGAGFSAGTSHTTAHRARRVEQQMNRCAIFRAAVAANDAANRGACRCLLPPAVATDVAGVFVVAAAPAAAEAVLLLLLLLLLLPPPASAAAAAAT